MMATRGQKRHLVTLENPGVPVPDADGGFTQAWTVLSPSTMRAEIKPATVRDLERSVASTVQSTASHIVTMDYHSQVTTQTRLTWTGLRDGRVHVAQVTGVQDPEQRSLELVLACEETVT